ncbi:MAG: lipopolysaccharide biosynthesis protein [Gemmatimonadales bacterium]
MVKRSGSSLTHRTLDGMLWTGGGKAARALLQILVLAVLSRLVSAVDFGVLSAALVVIGFSQIFSRLGLGPALVQIPELEQRHLKAAFTLSVLTSFAWAGGLWLAAPAIAAFYRIDQVEPVLRALVWMFPITGIAVVSGSLLQRELKFRWLAQREVASYLVGYGVVGVVLASAGWGVWALVWANLAQAGVNTLLLMLGRPPSFSLWPDRRSLAELSYFSGGFTLGRIANYLAIQGDNLVTGRWLGPAALGIYGRAYQLMAVPSTLFGDVLDNVLFPSLARLQGDQTRLGTAYVRGVSLIALAMLPASAVLVVLSPELIRVVLGPRWDAVVLPFQILTSCMLFRTSYKMSDSLARATGSVYRRAWRQVLYATLVIGGAWIGQHWGVAGVAVAVSVALVINFLSMADLSLRLCGLNWGRFVRAHAPAFALAVLCGLVAWGSVSLLRQAELPAVVRLVTAGSLSLLTALGLLRYRPEQFLGPEGTWMLQTMRTYVTRRFAVSPVAEQG